MYNTNIEDSHQILRWEMSTRSRQGVTIYNSNSDCELRRRKLWKDRSCKYLSEVLHRPVCKAHKDKLERESSSNFDNDNTYELLATRVNRTGLWFLTTGMNKHGLNCMSQAMPRVLKFVSLRFHCDIVSWNGLFTLRCRNHQLGFLAMMTSFSLRVRLS